MRFHYILHVDFREDRDDLLYEGDSYYTAKLIDHLRIAYNQITISFDRSEKIDAGDYLFSAFCPVRIQLYRAACFFLAVTGRMPPVENVLLVTDKQEIPLDKERLTKHWANCCIQLTLDPDSARKCFEKDGKACYTAITYYLKAQLDSFPHDCFRAAWSGLNALYDGLSKKEKESTKLNVLAQNFAKHPPARAQAYVKSLPETFWKGLNWYNFVQNQGLDKIQKEVLVDNKYQDKTVYSYLGKYVISLLAQEEKKNGENGKALQLRAVFEDDLKKKQKKTNEQLRFLVTRYCYMLRNRSFHADKPYPVFGLFDETEDGTEAVLTKILLLVIRDMLADKE